MEGRRGQRELCGKRGPSEKYKATWKNRFCLYFKALQFFVCCFRPDIGFFQFFFLPSTRIAQQNGGRGGLAKNPAGCDATGEIC